jgi:hypothetical protein
MKRLCRSRILVRPLAAWLLLWFVLMAGAPYRAVPALPSSHGGVAAHDSAHVHAGHHAHAEAEEDGDDDHDAADGGDSGGHASHCPLCLHAAAPPLRFAAGAMAGLPPAPPQAVPADAPLRLHSAAPPPARGPPSLS